MRINMAQCALVLASGFVLACSSSSKSEPQSNTMTAATQSATISSNMEAGAQCAALAGGPMLGGLPADAASSGPCGAGGTCVQGPFCTPGGCTEAGVWVCAYSTQGPCRVSNGQLVCGPEDGGTTD